MRGRPGPGAFIGLVVGVVLVVVVIWLPAALTGDFFEVTDPLVFMGLPMIAISTAVGGLVGVPEAPAPDDGDPPRTSSRVRGAVVAASAVATVVLATGFFLEATGAL